MSADEIVSFSLELNVEKAETEVRRLLTVASRTLDLVRRLSGDENLNVAIMRIQQAIAIANQLRLAIIALQAASGPVGWALALIGMATFAVSAGQTVMEMG